MFEDETIDIACLQCGHMNSILVRDFEEGAETHFTCEGCGARVKIEGEAFHKWLAAAQIELENLEREAARVSKPKRPRKGDLQI